MEFHHLVGNYYTYVNYGELAGKNYPANAMYLVTKSGVVLFDTPWDESYYQPLLDSIWVRHHKKVILCIATHYHVDRTGGLKYYASKGIKTYATVTTDSLCIIYNEKRAKNLLTSDTTFNINGNQFKTYYPGPGHTLDNILIWCPKEKILYGGCFIKSVQDTDLGNLKNAQVKEWAYSIQRLQKAIPDPNFIIVGHHDYKNMNSINHTLDLVNAYNATHK